MTTPLCYFGFQLHLISGALEKTNKEKTFLSASPGRQNTDSPKEACEPLPGSPPNQGGLINLWEETLEAHTMPRQTS